MLSPVEPYNYRVISVAFFHRLVRYRTDVPGREPVLWPVIWRHLTLDSDPIAYRLRDSLLAARLTALDKVGTPNGDSAAMRRPGTLKHDVWPLSAGVRMRSRSPAISPGSHA